jgi:hypothetical protein
VPHEQGLADFEAPTWFAVFLRRNASEPIVVGLRPADDRLAGTRPRNPEPSRIMVEQLGKSAHRLIKSPARKILETSNIYTGAGRSGGTRTPSPRFWRPVL